jgi:two-component system chemotaxis sensor kinase CheA
MQEFSEDPALVQEFITESEELLQSMDQDMVQLESTPEDDELLNRIFRALHTIKGTSGFLGYDPIVTLGHRAEDVLNALRRHEIKITRQLMDALLASRDQLGKMLNDLRAGSLKQQYPIEKLIAELEKVQKGAAALPNESKAAAQEEEAAQALQVAPVPDAGEPVPAQKASAFVRAALSRVIESAPSLEVCGTARHGLEALEKIRSCDPMLSRWTSKCRCSTASRCSSGL